MPRTRRAALAGLVLLVISVPGCSSSHQAEIDLWPGLGQFVAAIGRAPGAFFELVDSGAHEVVGPGADLEEWMMRYGR